jgi:DNA topoisomerase-1
MAVDSFIPVGDVKITTEKEVKRKPSIEELTTIETPGKPVPASFMARGKKSRKKTKEEVGEENVKIAPVKRDSILIVTEKPQAALKIASALGTPRKYAEDKVAYYEVERNGKKIVVASAVGHLYNLTYAPGQKGWPIFNTEWEPSYEKKSAAFTKKYFEVLKMLCRKAKEIIIATDFDIEGEVIGWNVLRFICKEKSAKRMKFSTLTKDELEKSYDNPLPELAWNNAFAGETRHIVDWLYGINLSRALMSAIKTSGLFRILSIGRVQGPALKIIVDREREIAAFKPEPYWQVFATSNGIRFQHPTDIFDKKELDKFKNIKEANAETTKREEKITPPVPFDLTTLQTEAYRHYKISPSETLKIAQQLYIDGLISYPRTSSQKIPDAIEPKKILKLLAKQFPKEVKIATRDIPIEGKKSDPAHPSIYPTGELADVEERADKIYNLIAKRFISAFSPDAITENKRIVLLAVKDPKIKFTASAMKVKEAGWTKVYPTKMEESELPDLNGKVKIDKIEFEEKETQPPKRYSPASLVSTLEKKNLGTKATRSTIVDTLFERGYLDGKSIQATPLGLKLIEALEKYSPIIIDENLTKHLEDEMEKIVESKEDLTGLQKEEDKIVEEAKKVITDISKEFKLKETDIGKELAVGLEIFRKEQMEANTIIQCPVCKKGSLRILFNRGSYRYFVACSAYPECKTTYSLPPNALVKKSEKICESCNWPKVMALRKGKRPWEFCFNINCEANKALREEWERKKALKEAAAKANASESQEAAAKAAAEGKTEEKKEAPAAASAQEIVNNKEEKPKPELRVKIKKKEELRVKIKSEKPKAAKPKKEKKAKSKEEPSEKELKKELPEETESEEEKE